MRATLNQLTNHRWPPGFLKYALPYSHTLYDWTPLVHGNYYEPWANSPFQVEVRRVQQLKTRAPGFHDYDLAAELRASSGLLRLSDYGPELELIVDAAVGIHMTNAGQVHARMWYGCEMGVLTALCPTRPDLNTSWVIPAGPWRVAMREALFLRLTNTQTPGKTLNRRLLGTLYPKVMV